MRRSPLWKCSIAKWILSKMARFNRRVEPFEEPTVNLTPLIDVVFVILIGFILIAPLLETDQIALADAPENSSHVQSNQEMSPIAIYVKADNSLVWKGERVSLSQLKELLLQAKRKDEKAIPQLFHDKKAYFGTYQNVKNLLESLGFERVDVVLQPS